MTDHVPPFHDDPVFFLEASSICKDIRDGVQGLLDISPSLGTLFNPSYEFFASVWLIFVQRNVPSLSPAYLAISAPLPKQIGTVSIVHL